MEDKELNQKEKEIEVLFKSWIDNSEIEDISSVEGYLIRIKNKDGKDTQILAWRNTSNNYCYVELSSQKISISYQLFKTLEDYFQLHIIKLNRIPEPNKN